MKNVKDSNRKIGSFVSSAVSRRKFLRTAGIGIGSAIAAGTGFGGGVHAAGESPSEITIFPNDADLLNKVRDAVNNYSVVKFDGSSGTPFVLSDNVPNGSVLEITKPVKLQALDPNHPPILLVSNTAFDTNYQNYDAHAIRVVIPEGTPKRNVGFQNLIINDNGNRGAGLYRGIDVVACDDCEIINCKVFTDPLFPYMPTSGYFDTYGIATGSIHIGCDISQNESIHSITGTVRIENCHVSGPIGIDFSGTELFNGKSITDITAHVSVTGCYVIAYALRGIGGFNDQDVLWNNGKYTVRKNVLDSGVQNPDWITPEGQVVGIPGAGLPTVWGGLGGTLNFSDNELIVNGYTFVFVGSAIEIEHTNRDTFRGYFNNNVIHMNGPSPQLFPPFTVWTMPIFSTDVLGDYPTYNLYFNNNTIDGPCNVDVAVVFGGCFDCVFSNLRRENMVRSEFQTLLLVFLGIPYTGHVDYALTTTTSFTHQSTNNVVIDNYQPVPAVVIDASDPNLGTPDYAGQNILLGNLRKAYNVTGQSVQIPAPLIPQIEAKKKLLRGE